MQASWDFMEQHGNTSGSSNLAILHHELTRSQLLHRNYIVCLAGGPGETPLCISGMLDYASIVWMKDHDALVTHVLQVPHRLMVIGSGRQIPAKTVCGLGEVYGSRLVCKLVEHALQVSALRACC